MIYYINLYKKKILPAEIVRIGCQLYYIYMVAEKATLQLLIVRSLFAYRISHSRGP